MRSVIVCNKADAEAMVGDPSGVVISITDPKAPPARLSSAWAAVFRLSFHDKEDEEAARVTGLWRLFDEAQAIQCIDFIERHRAEASSLLIHCTAGLSRSPALARAVCEYLDLPVEQDWPLGNELVRKKFALATRRFLAADALRFAA